MLDHLTRPGLRYLACTLLSGLAFSAPRVAAVEMPSDTTCTTGTAIPRAGMSIPAALGGWLVPAELDAQRLIDDTWNGWAPNFPTTATATVALGGSFVLSEVRVFTDNNAGNLEIRWPGGGWQAMSYNSTSPWKVLPVAATADAIELRRDNALDNVIELRVCAAGTGLPTLSIGDASVAENAGTADFPVTLSAANATTVTVQYTTTDGSATAGNDYLAQSGLLTFPPGTTTQNIAVTVVDDTVTEPTEVFSVDLVGPIGATVSTGHGVGTITDDDTPPSGCTIPADTAIIEAGPNENPSGWVSLTSDASVIATLTGVEVTVLENGTVGNLFHVVDGWDTTPIVTAAADSTTVVAIPPGTFSGSVQGFITHTPGAVYRAALTLCTGSAMPQLSVDDVSVGEAGGAATFTVSISAAASTSVTVQVATRNGTATAGSDFATTGQVVTFPANDGTPRTLTVPILDDGSTEPSETFFVDLSNPSTNATIADGLGVGTILDNDGGACTYDPNVHFQADLPAGCSVTPSPSFGSWTDRLDTTMRTALGVACIDLHDRFWTRGPDLLAYHTWHPPVFQGCSFGHEHGTDPMTSDVFPDSGGYPPFGFVMEQQHLANPTMPRHEDHFGHKVTVANNIRLAIGNSAGEDAPNIYATNITCDFMSKIHMGTYSPDAFTNHLHEYFLTLRCDDTHQGAHTEFSVKLLAPFETANQIDSHHGGLHRITDVLATLQSAITKPEDDTDTLIDPLVMPHLEDPNGVGGGREFKNFPAMQWHPIHAVDQAEIWAMSSGGDRVQIPGGGGIKFAPYYVTKNPSRMLDEAAGLVIRTVDLCYLGGNRVPGPFCSALPSTHPGGAHWKREPTPFNGGMRAINFKGFGLKNAGGPTEFCTNVFGAEPELLANCGPHDIRQKAASIRNYWQEQGDAASPCILDVDGVCRQRNLEGTIEKAEFVYPTAANDRCDVTVSQGTVGPYIDPATGLPDGLKPAGIGFEWFANHCEDPGIHPPN